MRVLKYTVSLSEEGWSVEQFLRIKLRFSKKQISRLKFRENGILLNGTQCRTTGLLKTGDILGITLDETGKRRRNLDGCELSEAGNMQLLYEDEDLLAVYKPGGIPVHPSHGHGRDSLWNQVVTLEEQRGESWTPRILGRLDKDTSGIILFAKTTEAAAALATQREKKLLNKEYVALAEGRFSKKEDWIDAPIEKDPDYLNRMRVGPKGLSARTHYRVLAEEEDRSLLLLELEQGRTHQIRVHLASKGHPLVGDCIYNPVGNADKLHLCAWRLHFQKPFTGELIEITLPFPEWAECGMERV